MIILIGAEKGGAGKTTISTNLAAVRANMNKKVLLLDADAQQSVTLWSQVRANAEIKPTITCKEAFGKIDRKIINLAKEFDDIIIDTGGQDSEELSFGALVANYFYIPAIPSQLDLWSIQKSMKSIVDGALRLNPKMKVRVLFNKTSTHPMATEIGDAQDFIKNNVKLEVSQAIVYNRIAYRKAISEGCAVAEMKNKDKKAILEIQKLYEEIYND